MKIVKIIALIASSFLVTLLALIITVKNPEVALYEKTIETLMDKEHLTCEQDVLDNFPDLKDIKSSMARVAYLDGFIQGKTQGPAPMVTAAESKQLTAYREEARQIRKEIKEELNQIIITQSIQIP